MITERELREALQDIPNLKPSEEAFVRQFLDKYMGSGGINRSELKDAIRYLKEETSDPIERSQADRIEQKLLELL